MCNSVLLFVSQPHFNWRKWNFAMDSSKTGAHWNQYTITEIITNKQRNNRKMNCLNIYPSPFIKYGCIRKWESCNCHLSILVWDAWVLLTRTLSDGRVVFEYSCGSSSSMSHHVVCMRKSHAPLEWSQPQWHIHAMVYTGTKEEVWQQKHCSCFFREVLSWFCLMPSTFKELANSWWDSSGSLETVSLGENPAPLLCLQNAHCCSWELYVHVINRINNSKLLSNIIQQLWL